MKNMNITFKLKLTWKGVITWWQHYPKNSLEHYQRFWKAIRSIWKKPIKEDWSEAQTLVFPKKEECSLLEFKHSDAYNRIRVGESTSKIRAEIINNATIINKK